MGKIIKNTKVILLLILIIALFLRIWQIDKVPVSLFGDELDLGYQAYSILKTGKDYSGNPWPIHFQSLAEWRTPLYLYSAVPTVALFGISPLGVRLPAVIFGVLGVWAMYLMVKELFKSEKLALVSALVLTFSPWHMQYSRAGFEVTELLFFLLIGLYFFSKGLKNGKWLWLSMASFALMPWVYSTAKMFTPMLLVALFLIWRKEIFSIPRKYLIYAAISLIVIGVPIAYSTVLGGGTARFGYVSVFTDPTTEPEVGTARQLDARKRGENRSGLKPTVLDKAIHNKFTFWGGNILRNYFQALSSDFLFNEGDLNLRHSIKGIGQFYKLEAIPMVIGAILFFAKHKDKRSISSEKQSLASSSGRKTKYLIAFWILAGVIPAAITRDGGTHATRLFLILPPFIFLIAYGLVEGINLVKNSCRKYLTIGYIILFAISFGFFIHSYFVHSPWDSERWWHFGYKEAIQSMKSIQGDYSKVIISMAGEPSWIFFAGWYQYPPELWHAGYPFKKTTVKGFGEISYIDKYYFGSPSVEGGVYGYGKVIDKKTLYIATATEVKVNLILEPERTPGDLKLVKAIAYPSGEPAFYLFTGVK